jgi:hypothetical protein
MRSLPGSPLVALRDRSRTAFRAVVGRARVGPSEVAGWIEGSWPLLVPAVLALLAPFCIGASLRAAAGVTMELGLGLGLLVTLGVGRAFWPALREQARGWTLRDGLGFELLVLVPVVHAFLRLYNARFGGFPNLDGWDGGTHVQLRRDFVTDIPAAYHGFVTFYAVTHWLDRWLSLDAFRSFRATYYLTVAAYVAFPALLAVAHVRGQRHLPRLGVVAAAVAAVGVELYLLDRIGLPLLHFMQAMGYYPMVFGLLPVLLLWGIDAFVRAEPLRLAGMVLAVVLVLALYLLMSRGQGGADRWQLVRRLRFPLLLVLAGSAGWAWFRSGNPPQDYYLTKYQMYGSLILVPAVTVTAADLFARIADGIGGAVRRRFSPIAVRSLLGLACVGLILAVAVAPWGTAYRAYAAGFRERSRPGRPPYGSLRPLVDLEATTRIQEILAREQKRFGGYLVSWYPQFNFMNPTLGHFDSHLDGEVVKRYFLPTTEPGHCVFWIAAAQDTFQVGDTDFVRGLRRQIASHPAATCAYYVVPWKSTAHSLCHRCY